jgi:hypothetical protein
MTRHLGTTGPSIWTAIGSGVVAGVVGGFVSNPGGMCSSIPFPAPVLIPFWECHSYADIVLIRMQAERGKPVSERYGYRNVLHGLYRIARDEGPRQLLRGADVTVFRAILTNTGQLAS